MKNFTLQCGSHHLFTSWFKDAETCAKLIVQGLVTCPDCGDNSCTKLLSSPSIKGARQNQDENSSNHIDGNVTMSDEAHRAVRQFAKEINRYVREHSTYVGENFAQKAKSLHDSNDTSQSIYGEASVDEIKTLLDQGIDLLPIPKDPEKLS